MDQAINFTPFLLGFVLGLVLSALLEIRAVALLVAAAVVLYVMYLFLQGGQDALITVATRVARFAQEGQASGHIAGMLAGKLAGGVRRGLLRRGR